MGSMTTVGPASGPVGVVGAGLMGSAVAGRLLEAGYAVSAYDIDPARCEALRARGAGVAASIAALARECPAIVLAVFNTDQVEAVVEGEGGILASATADAMPIVVCTSTCDPERIAALGERGASRGLRLLEVPVSGTSRQVAQGDGVALVAGDRALMDAAAGMLAAICPQSHYLGALGNGSRAKLAVNLILGLNRAAMAEGLVFADRLGLDREAFLNVARGSAACSAVMDTKGPLMARRQYDDPQSKVDQSLKDFRLMIEQAASRGQPLPFASVYAELLDACMRRGEAGKDNAILAEAIFRLGEDTPKAR